MKIALVWLIISSAVLGFSDAATASTIFASVSVTGRATNFTGGHERFCGLVGCQNFGSEHPDEPDGIDVIDRELDPPGLQVTGASASGHAMAHAAIGDLGVGVSGSAQATVDGQTVAESDAEAEANWQDRITLSTTRLPFGRTLRAVSAIFLDGDLNALPQGKGGAQATLQIRSPFIVSGNAITFPTAPYGGETYGNELRNVVTTISQPVVGAFRVTLNVFNGQPATMGIELRLIGSARSDAGGAFRPGLGIYAGDVSGSLHWGGIESVTDEFGNPIDDWTVTSDSGFDYSKPFGVPEPSSLLLFAMTLCVWSAGRRTSANRR